MNPKVLFFCKGLAWCLFFLLFPVLSGALSVILALDPITALFLQGAVLLVSLLPPAMLAARGKWSWRELGFAPFDKKSCKAVFWFLPVLALFVPAACKGFRFPSAEYVLGNLFLYALVGVSEEVYFRGILPYYLKKRFSAGATVWIASLVFALGHLSAALSGMNGLETLLTLVNALLFGWLAMEMTRISDNLLPAMAVHFLFDFETKVVVLAGGRLLLAELLRGVILCLLALWLTGFARKHKKEFVG